MHLFIAFSTILYPLSKLPLSNVCDAFFFKHKFFFLTVIKARTASAFLTLLYQLFKLLDQTSPCTLQYYIYFLTNNSSNYLCFTKLQK